MIWFRNKNSLNYIENQDLGQSFNIAMVKKSFEYI
jgi:hypothetical protein